MSKVARLLALATLLALAACAPELPPYYYAPPPPPLQPYMGPPIAYAPAPAKPVKKRRYAKKRPHKVHCRCVPVQ